jgi:hypothetical protein
MKATSTRRAVLAGAAALPAISLPAIATEPDPIFAAIERHKMAFRIEQETCRAEGHMDSSAPEYKATRAAVDVANDACNEAAYALAELEPTTKAGALALLKYVEEFNAGHFVLAETLALPRNQQWRSGATAWPEHIYYDDETEELFSFALMGNVCRALKTLAVRS